MTYLNKILYQLLKLLPQSIVKIFSRRYIAGFDFNETMPKLTKVTIVYYHNDNILNTNNEQTGYF